MSDIADFARSIVAYAKACLAAAVTLFVLAPLGPDFRGYGRDPAEALLLFGITLFYGTLVATPFALVVLLLLHLLGSRNLFAAIAGGALAAVSPAIAFAIATEKTVANVPPILVLMFLAAGAVAGATYHLSRFGRARSLPAETSEPFR